MVNSLLGALGQQTQTAQSTIFTETNNATLQIPTHFINKTDFQWNDRQNRANNFDVTIYQNIQKSNVKQFHINGGISLLFTQK